jgi:hypothetical protein
MLDFEIEKNPLTSSPNRGYGQRLLGSTYMSEVLSAVVGRGYWIRS